MTLFEALILGLIQGLTEFIPVSSSGHLLLMHHAFGLDTNALGFDVALHIGTLLALVAFFYRDIIELTLSVFQRGPRAKLAYAVALATVPAVIAGVLLQDLAETTFRSPLLVCVTLVGMALVMIAAERYGRTIAGKKLDSVSFKQALGVGLAQAVALIPGVSRSGSTITTGLFVGLDRVAATRFSFLLSIPITFGAILKVLISDGTIAQMQQHASIFAVGIITAFISGMIAIRFLLRFVAKHSLDTFAYYRIALAALVVIALIAF